MTRVVVHAVLGLALAAGSSSVAAAQPLTCNLAGVRPTTGLSATTAPGGDVVLVWTGDTRQELRLRLGVVEGAPMVRELGVRDGRGAWKSVATDVRPEFRIVTGLRRMSNQQMVPLRGLGLDITSAVIDEKKWDAFWDAPLDLVSGPRPGAAPVSGLSGNPPPAAGVAHQPGLPRKPGEITRARASFAITACDVVTDGVRLTASYEGLTLGPFTGRLLFTVYRGTNLIRVEAVARTNEPSVAYKYDMGLSGLTVEEGSRVVWRDLANLPQEYRLGGAVNTDPVPVKSWARVIVAEGPRGSIAALPPPHTFFWTREVETNLGYSWYRKDTPGTYAFGIRQAEREEHEEYLANFSLYSARPGTWQHMAGYFVVSSGRAEAAQRAALAFTRDDRYKPLPGHRVMVSHFHTSMGERLLESGSLDTRLPDIDALRATGVDIVSITDRPSGPKRLETMAAFYEGARRHSDSGFLVMPNEEAANILGGHWDILLSKPIFWTRDRKPDQPFVEEHPTYGKVYRTGSPEDVMEMAERENALIFMPHPRTKGSTNFPDAVKDSFQFKHDRYKGVGWRWGMGLDLSEKRLSERRVLPLLDDMNNWMAGTGAAPKQIHAITETYHKQPGDDIYANNPVSYLRLDRVPGVDDMTPVIETIKRGDYFVTSGEVLIPTYEVRGAGPSRTVVADVEWTFPLEFVEVVWGDGRATGQVLVSATHLQPFGRHRFEIPFDASGKRWVRFAAWDSAGNGALVQPIWLDPAPPSAALQPPSAPSGSTAQAAPRSTAARGGPAPAVIGEARQLLAVTTPGWDAVQGSLQRYERASTATPWTPVGDAISIVVGHAGLAWDAALAQPPTPGPSKREGDGRSPAGAFALGPAFGYAPASEAGHLKLPYRQATSALECVDDPASRLYNQLVDRSRVPSVDWKSSEQMRRPDELYRWGVVVEYNTDPATPYRGSCIFLHIADAAPATRPANGTTGCTAMTAPALQSLMTWLNPAEKPVLVQLPEPEFRALAPAWHIPHP